MVPLVESATTSLSFYPAYHSQESEQECQWRLTRRAILWVDLPEKGHPSQMTTAQMPYRIGRKIWAIVSRSRRVLFRELAQRRHR